MVVVFFGMVCDAMSKKILTCRVVRSTSVGIITRVIPSKRHVSHPSVSSDSFVTNNPFYFLTTQIPTDMKFVSSVEQRDMVWQLLWIT